MKKRSNKVIAFLFENSLFLIFGAFAGLAWANIDHEGYEHLLHLKLSVNNWIGTLQTDGTRVIDMHYLVNDILMVLFFAIAGKEVWEATLPGGPLNNPRRAAVPIVAAVGGMAGPAFLYLWGASLLGQYTELNSGWAIPCATDIAFSYMVARIIFGPGHPAIPFLLLLAIADDAMGLIIIAAFYPQEEVQFIWMLLPVAAIIIGLIFRRKRLQSFWWYIAIPGVLSWIGFAKSGIHPALGLLPIIPTLPHEHVDKGLFNWEELKAKDTLNEFEHWWKNPVELILALFGFFNAGVVFSAIGSPTFLVLAGLLLGKPIGIWLSGMLVAKGFKFGLPEGITPKDLLVIGFAGGIGFTVALFVATVAFPPGAIQDAAKMGALFSFSAAILTYLAAKVIGIKKLNGAPNTAGH
ncbi:MAG: Na+/H+ antiporter NhaA [bacterium]